jgi:hypothetical protein
MPVASSPKVLLTLGSADPDHSNEATSVSHSGSGTGGTYLVHLGLYRLLGIAIYWSSFQTYFLQLEVFFHLRA